MKSRSHDRDLLRSQLKHILVDMFGDDIMEPDSIADDTPLTEGAFDLDSFDLLELAMCIEEEFGVVMEDEGRSCAAFRSIAVLSDFIDDHSPRPPISGRSGAALRARIHWSPITRGSMAY